MASAIVGVVLIGHGLITSMIGLTTVTRPDAPALAMPSWLAWWPGPFGRSWLFDALGLGTPAAVIGGLLWLTAGLLLLVGGLGWFGVGMFEGVRVQLLLAGAGVGLVALALYFHPIYVVAAAINIGIVIVLWGQLATARGSA